MTLPTSQTETENSLSQLTTSIRESSVNSSVNGESANGDMGGFGDSRTEQPAEDDPITAVPPTFLTTFPTASAPITSPTPTLERVSTLVSGSDSFGNASSPSLSSNGRYVAFSSDAGDLVTNDTNGVSDIFVRDRTSNTVERVSIASDGSQNSQPAYNPSLSADGRYVAFQSDTADLLPGVIASASENASGNANGNASSVFVYDRLSRTVERVSADNQGNAGNGFAGNAEISADGRYVAYKSAASNLVDGDSNNQDDIFVYDRERKVTERVSLGSGEGENNGNSDQPTLSADGRFVAFTSSASNLVANDTNGVSDIFVYDRTTKSIERISVGNSTQNNPQDDSQISSQISGATEANGFSNAPSISADGRYVSFSSSANNLVSGDNNNVGDVFVYDRETKGIERISRSSSGGEGNNFSFNHEISADGRYVTYSSVATNLVSNDTNRKQDIFLYDRQTQTTERLSASTAGIEGNGESSKSAISGDGRAIAFQSSAYNLVKGDSNARTDAFVFDRGVAAPTPVSNGPTPPAPLENSPLPPTPGDNNPAPPALEPSAPESPAPESPEPVDNGPAPVDNNPAPPAPPTPVENSPIPEPSPTPVEPPVTASNVPLINFSGIGSDTVSAFIEVTRDAGYENTVGFYVVENEQGAVKDSVTGGFLLPDDEGYAKAAIAQRINDTFTGNNEEVVLYKAQLPAGRLVSTFIVSNGSVESLVDGDSTNNPDVFFGSLGANSDRTNHIRSLGNNTFGYEDLLGGGDNDFNDMVVKVTFE
jgi:Tol biopolymer transport system component